MLGAATLVYGALVATSLAGGPLKPEQILPFPELVNNLPVLDQQQPAAQPGGKNTPAAKPPAVRTAKKITAAGKPAQSGVLPVPTATAPGPGTATTTAPPAEATDVQPSTQPTTQPPPRPTKTQEPSADPTKSAAPTPTSEGTALPGVTSGAGPTPGTVPVGETAAGVPATTSAAAGAGGGGRGSGGTAATPGASASLGLA